MQEKGRRSYGKELNAILNVADTEEKNNSSIIDHEHKLLNIHQIVPGKFQPRKDFDECSLEELAESIKENGVLQPILVRKSGDLFEIIAGERRWRATQLAGLLSIPAIIHDVDNEAALVIGIIENIQRKDLNPIEEAAAFQRLINEFSMTHDQVAKVIGRSRAMISNMLRLLNLPDSIKNLLAQKKLEMGHARALLTLNENEQISLANNIVDRNLSVRNTELLVQKAKGAAEVSLSKSSAFEEQLNRISELFYQLISLPPDATVRVTAKNKLTIQIGSKRSSEYIINKLEELVDNIDDSK